MTTEIFIGFGMSLGINNFHFFFIAVPTTFLSLNHLAHYFQRM